MDDVPPLLPFKELQHRFGRQIATIETRSHNRASPRGAPPPKPAWRRAYLTPRGSSGAGIGSWLPPLSATFRPRAGLPDNVLAPASTGRQNPDLPPAWSLSPTPVAPHFKHRYVISTTRRLDTQDGQVLASDKRRHREQSVFAMFDKVCLRQLKQATASMHGGDYQQALQQLNQLIVQHPMIARLFTMRAFCFSKAGHHRQSLLNAKRAATLDPQEGKAHYLAGMSAARLGRARLAATFLDAALKHDPSNAKWKREFEIVVRRIQNQRSYFQVEDKRLREKAEAVRGYPGIVPKSSGKDLGHSDETLRRKRLAQKHAQARAEERESDVQAAEEPSSSRDFVLDRVDVSDIINEQMCLREALLYAIECGQFNQSDIAQKLQADVDADKTNETNARLAVAAPTGTQIHVKGIGVEGWDGTAAGRGFFESHGELDELFSEYGKVKHITVEHVVVPNPAWTMDLVLGTGDKGERQEEQPPDGQYLNRSWALITMKDTGAVDRALAKGTINMHHAAHGRHLKLARFWKHSAKASRARKQGTSPGGTLQQASDSPRYSPREGGDADGDEDDEDVIKMLRRSLGDTPYANRTIERVEQCLGDREMSSEEQELLRSLCPPPPRQDWERVVGALSNEREYMTTVFEWYTAGKRREQGSKYGVKSRLPSDDSNSSGGKSSRRGGKGMSGQDFEAYTAEIQVLDKFSPALNTAAIDTAFILAKQKHHHHQGLDLMLPTDARGHHNFHGSSDVHPHPPDGGGDGYKMQLATFLCANVRLAQAVYRHLPSILERWEQLLETNIRPYAMMGDRVGDDAIPQFLDSDEGVAWAARWSETVRKVFTAYSSRNIHSSLASRASGRREGTRERAELAWGTMTMADFFAFLKDGRLLKVHHHGDGTEPALSIHQAKTIFVNSNLDDDLVVGQEGSREGVSLGNDTSSTLVLDEFIECVARLALEEVNSGSGTKEEEEEQEEEEGAISRSAEVTSGSTTPQRAVEDGTRSLFRRYGALLDPLTSSPP